MESYILRLIICGDGHGETPFVMALRLRLRHVIELHLARLGAGGGRISIMARRSVRYKFHVVIIEKLIPRPLLRYNVAICSSQKQVSGVAHLYHFEDFGIVVVRRATDFIPNLQVTWKWFVGWCHFNTL